MKKKLSILVLTMIFVFSFSAIASACYLLTPGYWKNHTDVLDNFLPIQLGDTEVTTVEQALIILQGNGDSSNGINKLSRNLLAMKLNFANFESEGTPVSDGAKIYAARADAVLLEYDPEEWDSLSPELQQSIVNLAASLDYWNNSYPDPED
jgi:hypothetical protein